MLPDGLNTCFTSFAQLDTKPACSAALPLGPAPASDPVPSPPDPDPEPPPMLLPMFCLMFSNPDLMVPNTFSFSSSTLGPCGHAQHGSWSNWIVRCEPITSKASRPLAEQVFLQVACIGTCPAGQRSLHSHHLALAAPSLPGCLMALCPQVVVCYLGCWKHSPAPAQVPQGPGSRCMIMCTWCGSCGHMHIMSHVRYV